MKSDQSQKPEKLKLKPYELMTMLGANEPCLSLSLKAALDEELKKDEYQADDMPYEQSFGKAMRYLAAERKDVFDPDNRDDDVALRLSTIFFREDGTRASSEEVMAQVEPDSMQLVKRDHGDHAVLDITADDDKDSLSTSLRVEKLKPSEADPDAVPSVHRYHSNPVHQEIEDRLLRLKERVLDAEEFSAVFEYFMDEFVDDPEFLEHGKLVTKAPRLKAALRQISRQIFPEGRHQVTQIMLKHLKRHQFFHGTATVNEQLATVFFFRDLGFGMVAITAPDSYVHYARVTMAVKKQ